jgi:hypothetical protein
VRRLVHRQRHQKQAEGDQNLREIECVQDHSG